MPLTITIPVHDDENESVFLQRVIQVALQAYRKNKNGSGDGRMPMRGDQVEAGGNIDAGH
jgi:hypothetical protein